MRIVIELDGTTAVVKPAAEDMALPHATAAAADAGAAPGADAAGTTADSDGGSPSVELLDSIAAAERASGDGAVPSASGDGGAAPQTL